MKELAEEFNKQYTCLWENNEKYITFTVPIEKEVTSIDKNGEEVIKNISYVLQFIDSTRFMASSFYQILLIIFLEEFIELNVYMDMRIRYARLAELDISIASVKYTI